MQKLGLTSIPVLSFFLKLKETEKQASPSENPVTKEGNSMTPFFWQELAYYLVWLNYIIIKRDLVFRLSR